MVADWFRPFGLRIYHAIRRAWSDPRRLGVSNRFLQLFRQHSWDAPKITVLRTRRSCTSAISDNSRFRSANEINFRVRQNR